MCKLWWNFRSQNSLWAKFMKQKYCPYSHPNQFTTPPSGSHIWMSMSKVQHLMEEAIGWDINGGDASLLWDNWSGFGCLGNLTQTDRSWSISDFIVDEKWNLNKIVELLPPIIQEKILSIDICPTKNLKDEMIWMRSSSGSFSIRSAFELLRDVKNPNFVDSMVWHSQLRCPFFSQICCVIESPWTLPFASLALMDPLPAIVVHHAKKKLHSTFFQKVC